LAADWWFCLPQGETAHYVGRQVCVDCHLEEYRLWAGSDHDLSMDHATPETVLGDFDDRQFTHFDLTSEMFRRGDKFFVRTEDRDGRMETFEVKYVFGVRPLQQYLVEFPDGRVQCLPFAWDTVARRWFHLYPDERIPPEDPLHWTRPLQNWNYMCAECHSTNLQKNYDLAEDTYHTTWSEIDVSCETCHGPGSMHVELAESWGFFWDRRYGYGLPKLKATEPSRVEIETCAPCHSRRRIIYPNPRPGEKFLDYYVPEILDGELYYADGQILDEDYVYGSFIQSRMYYEEVRCSNCHDPHSVRVKFNDNRLCTQCHVSATYDSPSHHYHPDSSKPGTMCVQCHMPETTYMVVDPRRDHSIRVPRPDLTVALGIPNACNGCHDDESKGETPEWAEAKCRQWYGDREGPRHFAHAIDGGRKGLPEAEEELAAVARRRDTRAMVRASAISLLSRYPTDQARAAAVRGLEDTDELVRAASVRAFENLPTDELRRRLVPMLHDPVRAVRTEAARLLTRIPAQAFSQKDRRAFDGALAEYLEGQRAVADQAAAHLNMAVVHANLGRIDAARQEYETAVRMDPQFVPARNNLGLIYAQKGLTSEAEAQYRAALELNPQFVPALDNLARLYYRLGKHAQAEEQFLKLIELEPDWADAHYSLGLLLAEDPGRMAEAAERLSRAARLAPQNHRYYYNAGLAFQKSGRPADAEKALLEADRLAPGNPEYVHALVILYTQQKQWDRALERAEELAIIRPGSPQARQLLEHIRSESKRSAKKAPTAVPSGP